MDESNLLLPNARMFLGGYGQFRTSDAVWTLERGTFLVECKLARAEDELKKVVVTTNPDFCQDSYGTTISSDWGPNQPDSAFQDFARRICSEGIESEAPCPLNQIFNTALDFSILDQSAFASGTIVDLETLSVRTRVEELREKIKTLRERLKLLSRIIKLLLTVNIFPRLCRKLIFREKAWCLLHGSHPPRESARVCEPAFAEPGRVPHAQVC